LKSSEEFGKKFPECFVVSSIGFSETVSETLSEEFGRFSEELGKGSELCVKMDFVKLSIADIIFMYIIK